MNAFMMFSGVSGIGYFERTIITIPCVHNGGRPFRCSAGLSNHRLGEAMHYLLSEFVGFDYFFVGWGLWN